MNDMDKITLYNQALAYLGDREYYRDTPSGNACDLWYPVVFKECLLYGSWTFATRRASLHPDDGVYTLPYDCVRLLKVSAGRYELRERKIHIEPGWQRPGTSQLEIRYLSDELARAEIIPDDIPVFSRGLVLMLAARMAPKLASSLELSAALEAQARQTLDDALYTDTAQHASNDQHPLIDILSNTIL